MRYLSILAFVLVSYTSFAQVLTQKTADIKPQKEYDNIKSIPLHSDENTSLFLIFVKKSVRKHVHQYHTEVVTILEGTGKMYLGGEYFDVKAGDHIVIPPNTAHGVVTTSSKPLKVISAQSPEFFGDDRVFIEEPEEEMAAGGKGKNNGKKQEEEEEGGIPEFEGEDD